MLRSAYFDPHEGPAAFAGAVDANTVVSVNVGSMTAARRSARPPILITR
ncbi:hypothetical protein ACFFWA_05925 [Actinomadura verrucosospora]